MVLSWGTSAGPERRAVPVPRVIALARLRRDRAAVTALVLATAILLACFVAAPVLSRVLGHGPNDLFPYAVDENLRPVGPLSRVPDTHAALVDDFGEIAPPPPGTGETLLLLGGDGALGRDLFLRILYGGQVSIAVGVLAALIALLIGVTFGALAGMMGGVLDAAVSRLSEIAMAFPILFLLVLVGASSFGSHLQDITFGVLNEGVFAVALLIGLFTWFYPARLVRTQLRSLRSQRVRGRSSGLGRGPGVDLSQAPAPASRPFTAHLGDARCRHRHPARDRRHVPERRRPVADGELGTHPRRHLGLAPVAVSLQPCRGHALADDLREYRHLPHGRGAPRAR